MTLSKIFKTSLLLCALFSAGSLQSKDIYVAPSGAQKGNGSKAKPFTNLEAARDFVRSLPKTEAHSIILKDGVYYLDQTFSLGKEDSGAEKFPVTYKSENALGATISGGYEVKNWVDSDGDGIWEAKLPFTQESRQLFVGARRATRARSKNGRGWVRNATGYSTPEGVENWPNHDDIELVFGYRWKHNRGQVKSVNGEQATLEPRFWKGSSMGPFAITDQNAQVHYVENNLALLDEAGEWYFDRHSQILYYKPHKGEQLVGNKAVKVVFPLLERIVEADGVQNVRFEQLNFKHGTWLFPNGELGYLSVQAGVTMRDINYVTIEDAFEACVPTAPNLYFQRAKNVVFAHNRFSLLGSAGLGFDHGSNYCTVFNNTFYRLSASALVISNALSHHDKGEQDLVHHILVDNNHIQDVSEEYRDNPAIILLWAQQNVITQNTIQNAPYSGVSIGWGWGRYDVHDYQFVTDNSGKGYSSPTVLKENHVINNMMDSIMMVRHDGGGIYNLSSNVGTHITGNVIRGCYDLNGAVYLDDGSRGFFVSENVSYDNRGPRADGHIKGAHLQTLENNDWSGRKKNFNPKFKYVVERAGQKKNRKERNIDNIIANLPSFKLRDEVEAPEFGLVFQKPVQASSNQADAKNVVDGNPYTYWKAGESITQGSLTIDLEQKIQVMHVGIAFGHVSKDNKVVYTRKGIKFKVEFSEDGKSWYEAEVYTKWVPRGTEVTTVQAIQDLLVAGKGMARYVRIRVLECPQDLGILRVKVKGDSVPEGSSNLAMGAKASQSSTYDDRDAGFAVDGSLNSGLSGISHTGGKEAQPYLQIDLGGQKKVKLIKIYNRTDCCKERLKDFYVLVSKKPFASPKLDDYLGKEGITEIYQLEAFGSNLSLPTDCEGRYVRVQKADSNIDDENVVSIAELQVWGE